MRKLDVYFNDNRAGILIERVPGRDYTFNYDNSYGKLNIEVQSVDRFKLIS